MAHTSQYVSNVLEGANAFWGVISCYLAFYFFRIAREEYHGFWSMLYRSIRRILCGEETTWRDGSLASATLFTGEFLRCLTVWSWRHFHVALQVPILTLAVAITALGGLCWLRVYSPQAASRRRSALLLGIALVMAIISVLT